MSNLVPTSTPTVTVTNTPYDVMATAGANFVDVAGTTVAGVGNFCGGRPGPIQGCGETLDKAGLTGGLGTVFDGGIGAYHFIDENLPGGGPAPTIADLQPPSIRPPASVEKVGSVTTGTLSTLVIIACVIFIFPLAMGLYLFSGCTRSEE